MLPSRNLYDVSREKLKEYIKQSKSKNIEFNYVMNSIWSGGKEFSDDGYRKIKEEIEEIVTCGVDRVSVSSPALVKIIRRNFLELKVTVSINLCVDAIHPMKRWMDQGVCKIVPMAY